MASPSRAARRTPAARRGAGVVAAWLVAVVSLVACGLIDGGPQPPESLTQAATDPQWAAAQIADLPAWQKGQPTEAWFFRPGGTSGAQRVKYVSGKDEASNYANAILKGSTRFNPQGRPGPFAASWHVEVKAAGYLRKNSLSYAVLVINNTEGICGGEDKPEGCTIAAPVVLPHGYRLMVWWPGEHQPQQTALDGQRDE